MSHFSERDPFPGHSHVHWNTKARPNWKRPRAPWSMRGARSAAFGKSIECVKRKSPTHNPLRQMPFACASLQLFRLGLRPFAMQFEFLFSQTFHICSVCSRQRQLLYGFLISQISSSTQIKEVNNKVNSAAATLIIAVSDKEKLLRDPSRVFAPLPRKERSSP